MSMSSGMLLAGLLLLDRPLMPVPARPSHAAPCPSPHLLRPASPRPAPLWTCLWAPTGWESSRAGRAGRPVLKAGPPARSPAVGRRLTGLGWAAWAGLLRAPTGVPQVVLQVGPRGGPRGGPQGGPQE